MSKVIISTGVDGVEITGSKKVSKEVAKAVAKLKEKGNMKGKVARVLLAQVLPVELEFDEAETTVCDGVYTITYEADSVVIEEALKISVKSILKAENTSVVEEVDEGLDEELDLENDEEVDEGLDEELYPENEIDGEVVDIIISDTEESETPLSKKELKKIRKAAKKAEKKANKK
jgi:hypothetical protein